MDGGEIITVHPQGRFKADNGIALAIAAAGLGIAWLPDCVIQQYVCLRRTCPDHDTLPTIFGRRLCRKPPPGQYPTQKVRLLTELLIKYFGQPPHLSEAVAKARMASSPSSDLVIVE
jgi:DNA-binding transcriptional LysR family regulator